MILDNKNGEPYSLNRSPSQWSLEVEFKRPEINYEDLSSRFNRPGRTYSKQFAHIYSFRLKTMKDRVLRSCRNKWGSSVPFVQVEELSEGRLEKCIVIGTVYKHQELKPSILKHYSKECLLLPQQLRSNYVSDTDLLILQDETERIKLTGQFNTNKFITGVVVGLIGSENENGKFEVEDFCFAELEVSLERPLPVEDSYLVLVSGLNIGKPQPSLALELFADSIRGNLGCISDQEKWAKVCRVLIVGNSVALTYCFSKKTLLDTTIREDVETLEVIKKLDNFLKNLVRSVEVDLMPGEFDPTDYVLPQQVIYNCMLPESSKYKTFHSVTNPYECRLGGRRILGTSGQPVNNIKAFTDISNPLDVLEKTLLWCHLAPSAPDTLACHPCYEEDPFIIDEQPDIYFTGNQPEFLTRILNWNGYNLKWLLLRLTLEETSLSVVVNSNGDYIINCHNLMHRISQKKTNFSS